MTTGSNNEHATKANSLYFTCIAQEAICSEEKVQQEAAGSDETAAQRSTPDGDGW